MKLSISLPSAPVPFALDTSFDHTPQQSHGRTISTQISTPRTLDFLISPQEVALQETLLLKQKEEKEKDLAFSLTQLLEEYHWARKQIDLLRKGISLEERKYEILETEVELGKTTRIDLVKAQNDLLQQKLSELNYVLQLLMRERNMERILGITPGSLISLEAEE
ncbi:TolC family protein [Spirochaeta thermophila]|uniref:TolC family protein n=1 Tax=Winmispira thermophila TaxID=154 RepID=UPI0002ED1D5C|nr:TolC family protein [Spirochaeta thermophila]